MKPQGYLYSIKDKTTPELGWVFRVWVRAVMLLEKVKHSFVSPR